MLQYLLNWKRAAALLVLSDCNWWCSYVLSCQCCQLFHKYGQRPRVQHGTSCCPTRSPLLRVQHLLVVPSKWPFLFLHCLSILLSDDWFPACCMTVSALMHCWVTMHYLWWLIPFIPLVSTRREVTHVRVKVLCFPLGSRLKCSILHFQDARNAWSHGLLGKLLVCLSPSPKASYDCHWQRPLGVQVNCYICIYIFYPLPFFMYFEAYYSYWIGFFVTWYIIEINFLS